MENIKVVKMIIEDAIRVDRLCNRLEAAVVPYLGQGGRAFFSDDMHGPGAALPLLGISEEEAAETHGIGWHLERIYQRHLASDGTPDELAGRILETWLTAVAEHREEMATAEG